MQEQKSSPCGLSIGLEAGGQLGVVRATLSWVLLPEAPCSYATWAEHVNSCGLAGHRLPSRVRSPCSRGAKKNKDMNIVPAAFGLRRTSHWATHYNNLLWVSTVVSGRGRCLCLGCHGASCRHSIGAQKARSARRVGMRHGLCETARGYSVRCSWLGMQELKSSPCVFIHRA